MIQFTKLIMRGRQNICEMNSCASYFSLAFKSIVLICFMNASLLSFIHSFFNGILQWNLCGCGCGSKIHLFEILHPEQWNSCKMKLFLCTTCVVAWCNEWWILLYMIVCVVDVSGFIENQLNITMIFPYKTHEQVF